MASLLEQRARAILEPHRVCGAICRTWCLRYWLLPHLQQELVVNAWRGPLGSRHDFEFPLNSLEVKATTLNRGSTVHRINGIDQMTPPAHGSLYFLSVGLADEANGSESLPGIVDSIAQFLAAQDHLQALVKGRLMQVGYREIDRAEYLKTRYRVTHQSMYEVTEAFPKIVAGDFRSSSLNGVVRIEYDIALDGFGQLVIATAPEEPVARNIAEGAIGIIVIVCRQNPYRLVLRPISEPWRPTTKRIVRCRIMPPRGCVRS